MKQKTEANGSKVAAIRVRGVTDIKASTESTLKMLRLYKKNYCSIMPNNPVYAGMLKRVKDYITWGEIDEQTLNELVDKRGEQFNGREKDSKGKISYNDFMLINSKKIKKYFRLNSPRKGFGRKGLKHSFQQGGALGYRGNAINDLIKRMI